MRPGLLEGARSASVGIARAAAGAFSALKMWLSSEVVLMPESARRSETEGEARRRPPSRGGPPRAGDRALPLLRDAKDAAQRGLGLGEGSERIRFASSIRR